MPKIAIISDIHGNLSALEAVITALNEKNPDEWLCLGDIVGYGPNPAECLDIVIDMNIPTVLGNHDAGVADLFDLKYFRNPNRNLLKLSRDLINEQHMKWLKQLPLTINRDNWIAAHASPIRPERWKYLESAFEIRNMLGNLDKQFCFVGHTHKPSLVPQKLGIKGIKSDSKYLINPGSVGQSRDHDYRASCAILDTENNEFEILRLDYDVESNLSNIMKLGFTLAEANQLMRIT